MLAPEPGEPAEATVAARLSRAEAADDEYLVVQLPSRLPLASNRSRGGEDALAAGLGQAGGRRSEAANKFNTSSGSDDFDFSVAAAPRDLEEGRLGDLEVRLDGSVRLVIGDASFDVVEGTPFAHVEQLACVDAGGGPDAKCAFLGRVPSRLVCIPDVASLLKRERFVRD